MSVSTSFVKSEEQEYDDASNENDNSSNENDDSDADLSFKLAQLEARVMKMIDFVMRDISHFKNLTKKKLNQQDFSESNKENIAVDKWKRRIYVGNIHPSTPIEILTAHFCKYGDINDGFFFRQFDTCRNAFVEFSEYPSVEKALSTLHYLSGRLLKVGKARRREDSAVKDLMSYKTKNHDLRTLRYRPY